MHFLIVCLIIIVCFFDFNKIAEIIANMIFWGFALYIIFSALSGK
jgi:hypothetical protein